MDTKAKSSVDVKKWLKIAIPFVIGIIIACIAPPEGLTIEAMRFLGVFVCALCWMVTGALADHIIVILAMCANVLLGVVKFSESFSYFSSTAVWLVIGAFGLSAAIGKCGLLKRIAFAILKLFPESYRGQILALFVTGTVVSPLIPSLAAKCAILAPFTSTMSEGLGFKKSSKRAAGLFAAMFIPSSIFGMAFYSGAVPVFTVLGFLSEEQQKHWNWFSWMSATWLWLVVLAVLTFIGILIVCKPGKEEEASAVVEKGFAKKQLEALGPMSGKEKIALVLLIVALLGFMTTKLTGIDASLACVVVLALMCVFGLLDTNDFKTRIAWPSVIFIAGVFSLAARISGTGVSAWLAGILAPVLGGVVNNVWLLIPVVVVATYIIRIVIVSQTATIAIMFTIFGPLCEAAGISVWPVLFTCYVSTLVWHYAANNTTYATALAATGGTLVDFKDTFPMNICFMVCNLVACTASVPIWKLLGML